MPSTPKQVRQDPRAPLQISVVSRSPHVVAYRLWAKAPADTEWTVIGEGTTADDKPDTVTIGPFPNGTVIAYWVGIGGSPNSRYTALVLFAQNGSLLEGGTVLIQGRVDSDGLAIEEGSVELT